MELMHPIQVAPGQLLRLTFATASVEAGVGAHRVSLSYLAEPMGLPAGCVVLLGGSLGLFPGGWLGSLEAEPLPISATAAYPRPVDLTTTITDGQLLALEAARAGRDLELLVTVRATVVGATQLDYPAGSTQETRTIAAAQWALHAERLGALISVPLLVSLPLGDPDSRRAQAGDHLRAAMRAVSDARWEEAVREARLALDLHDQVAPEAIYPKGGPARLRDLPQRYAVLRDAVHAVASGAHHADEITADFRYSRSDALAVIGCVAALLQRYDYRPR